jgi:hypothetical protein
VILPPTSIQGGENILGLAFELSKMSIKIVLFLPEVSQDMETYPAIFYYSIIYKYSNVNSRGVLRLLSTLYGEWENKKGLRPH